MYPSTLYEMIGVPETVPAAMVESAALVESGGVTTAEGRTALAVLSDPDARADYDERTSQGLSFELALAWGVAAYAAGEPATARYHWQRAARIAPDNRAVARLLEAVADAPPEPVVDIPAPRRASARAAIDRVRHNSAFPHRLVRYLAALADEPADSEEAPAEADAALLVHGARELLQYDVAEAPRAYSMVLPVLRDHYPDVYALDAPFFDATASLLESHTPSAEYERRKRSRPAPRRPRNPDDDAPIDENAPPANTDLPPMDLPPLRIPRRRLEMPRVSMPSLPALPSPGPAWIGALIGALLGVRMGLFGMLRGAVLGFLISYAIVFYMSRKR